MSEVYKKDGIELRLGDWREVLADVECDAVITDPPYGERTHAKQFHGRRKSKPGGNWATSVGLGYDHLSPDSAMDAATKIAELGGGWVCIMTSHDLIAPITSALEAVGRYVFAPLPVVQRGMNVRLAGDGPSSWTVWLVVSRTKAFSKWGTLPGAYIGNPFDPGENKRAAHSKSRAVTGGKPLWLMRDIIRDYSNPGDLVCDPFCGGATTLIAAAIEGRRAIGAEIDPVTFEKACKRLDKGWTVNMFPATRKKFKPDQGGLDV